MNKPQINSPKVTINYISENAILLEWPEKICEKQHKHIMHCQTQIKQTLANSLIESIVSYASLIIYYRFEWFLHEYGADAQHRINALLQQIIEQPNINSIKNSEDHHLKVEQANPNKSHLIEIPVYYGEEAGWDLPEVAQRTKLSIAEVIEAHTQKTYRAFALGFTPGFCYLGQLTSKLQLPRKDTPRLKVPKGAVAIAGEQTAVYPNSSPGGWHILGQTPVSMTSASTTAYNNFESTINVGQNVKFVAISKDEFVALGGNVQTEKHHDLEQNICTTKNLQLGDI